MAIERIQGAHVNFAEPAVAEYGVDVELGHVAVTRVRRRLQRRACGFEPFGEEGSHANSLRMRRGALVQALLSVCRGAPRLVRCAKAASVGPSTLARQRVGRSLDKIRPSATPCINRDATNLSAPGHAAVSVPSRKA